MRRPAPEGADFGARRRALRRQRQRAWLKRMGFLDKPQIELKERGRPLTPGVRWGPFETMTIGFGQGIAVAPLQLAARWPTTQVMLCGSTATRTGWRWQ